MGLGGRRAPTDILTWQKSLLLARYETSRDHRFRTRPKGRLPGPGRKDRLGPRPLWHRRNPGALRLQDRGRRGRRYPEGICEGSQSREDGEKIYEDRRRDLRDQDRHRRDQGEGGLKPGGSDYVSLLSKVFDREDLMAEVSWDLRSRVAIIQS